MTRTLQIRRIWECMRFDYFGYNKTLAHTRVLSLRWAGRRGRRPLPLQISQEIWYCVVWVEIMQFFDTRQRIAKKTSKGLYPLNPLHPRCVTQGSGGNIAYIKLVPWGKYAAQRLCLFKTNCIFPAPIEFPIPFCLATPNDFWIIQFYQKAEVLQSSERELSLKFL